MVEPAADTFTSTSREKPREERERPLFLRKHDPLKSMLSACLLFSGLTLCNRLSLLLGSTR